jgi:hypothetical protein
MISPVSADENSALPAFRTKTKNVFVFKNGLGYFIREGKTTLENGWAVTDIAPHAVLGTYWIGSPDKNTRVEKVVGYKEKSTKSVPAVTMEELLKANIGKTAQVFYGDQTVFGRIHAVPENRATEPDAIDPSSYSTPRYGYSHIIINGIGWENHWN